MTPQTRGLVPEPAGQRIKDAMARRGEAQEELELAVADALKAGASIRELATYAGLSGTTIQKYGRAHGWPSQEQRDSWEATRAAHDEWAAKMAAAEAMTALMGEAEPDDEVPASR